MSAILVEGVKPTFAELERFEEQSEEINIELAVSGKEDPVGTHTFSMGDNVEVCVGDLENLRCREDLLYQAAVLVFALSINLLKTNEHTEHKYTI
ncbi:AAEL012259-PA [Aedes aegypti]|uniref:AAEL012259-PA n=1 Tax=Aedes aegypti TaxID=7159 RepID=Q16MM1_AEDAE|nr:AAEL012259-PA [Aedes aegypti]